MNIDEIIIDHYKKYPKIETQDFLKLIHQHTFGCGHYIINTSDNYDYLKDEWQQCAKGYDNEIFTYIGNGYSRFNLYNGKINNYNIDLIHKIFIASANSYTPPKSTKDIEKNLTILQQLCENKTINLSLQSLKESIRDFQNTNYAPISHSKTYHRLYHPAYRVVSLQYVKYLDLLASIENHIKSNDNTIVAIDGKAGSGKTLLSNFLKNIYDCNIIPMDYFFIPSHIRNTCDWEENIHLPRFMEEIYNGLKNKTNFTYGKFDCTEQQITEKINILPKKLTVIEGSYSISPYYEDLYTLKVFIDISPKEQLERIKKRNGKEMAEIFKKKWIPAENQYFEKYKTKEKADFIISNDI